MQTRNYPIAAYYQYSSPTTPPGFFAQVLPTSVEEDITALQGADDGKYLTVYEYFTSEPGGQFIFGTQYDNAIPLDSVIISFIATFRYAKTYNEDGPAPDQGLVRVGSPTGAFGALEEPHSYVAHGSLPVGDNWITTIASIPEYQGTGGAAVLYNTPASLVYLETGIGPDQDTTGDEVLFLDYVNFQVNFNLPPIHVGSCTIGDLFTNRAVVGGNFSMGQVNAIYPISYYFEWTDQDPTGGALVVTHLGPTTVVTTGGPGVLNPITTIPEDGTSMAANAQFWVRLVTYNADGVVVSGWRRGVTLATDRVMM